jgi:hypothetical protein
VSGHEFQESQPDCLTVNTDLTLILVLISISKGLGSVKPLVICVSLPIILAASICAVAILCVFRWLAALFCYVNWSQGVLGVPVRSACTTVTTNIAQCLREQNLRHEHPVHYELCEQIGRS